MRFVGVDLAWGPGTPDRPASETGIAVLAPTGEVLDAGWTRGPTGTARQVLGEPGGRPSATIVAPALPSQRR